MADQPETSPESREPAFRLQRAYVNFAQGRGGVTELSLTFGYKENDLPAIGLVPIVMSWEFVPVLIRLLQTQLDAYQEQIGPVRDIFDQEAKEPT